MPFLSPARRRAYNRDRARRIRAETLAALGPCASCGATEDLELDHIDRSTKLSHRIWTWAKARLQRELAKCQALCKPCHLAKTVAENSRPTPHGTHSGYAYHGCRCDDCRRAQRDYCTPETRQRLAAGRWSV